MGRGPARGATGGSPGRSPLPHASIELLRRLPGERGRPLVEQVELEAGGELLLTGVREQLVSLLVVENRSPASRGRGVVADHGAAGEVLQLLERAQALGGIGLVPVVAVREVDRVADVRADLALRLRVRPPAAPGDRHDKGRRGGDAKSISQTPELTARSES